MERLDWQPPAGPSLPCWPEFWPEHRSLFTTLLESVDWDTRMRARQTASYGRPYNYSQMRYPARPIHPALVPMIAAATAIVGFSPDNCLLNLYPDGAASMGFHSDARADLEAGTGVVVLSLGSPRSLVFRDKLDHGQTHALRLAPGSLIVLADAIQDRWQHAIPSDPAAGPRISVTLRRLSPPNSSTAHGG
jgi:alkylated DNA repair dioxygenase AlkB